tara:strand:- start:56860 stop:57423 length:564 start_codon:yes stop_codon:yes gene_type:complete
VILLERWNKISGNMKYFENILFFVGMYLYKKPRQHMNYETSVAIPVPLFLKNYLEKRYGTRHKLSKNSAIGLLIIEMAQRRYIKPVKIKCEPQTQYRVYLTEYYYKRKAFNINRKAQALLANLLLRLFYEDLVNTVYKEVCINKTPAKEVLLRFLQFYEINEDLLKFETAYMRYRRDVKKIKEQKAN